MALDYITMAAEKFAFGLQVYQNTDGGVIDVEYDDSGETLRTHVGGGLRPQNVEVVKAVTTMKVSLQEFEPTALPAQGTKADIVVTLLNADRTTTAKNFYRFKFTGVTQTQAQHAEGGATLNFEYESDDTGLLAPTDSGV